MVIHMNTVHFNLDILLSVLREMKFNCSNLKTLLLSLFHLFPNTIFHLSPYSLPEQLYMPTYILVHFIFKLFICFSLTLNKLFNLSLFHFINFSTSSFMIFAFAPSTSLHIASFLSTAALSLFHHSPLKRYTLLFHFQTIACFTCSHKCSAPDFITFYYLSLRASTLFSLDTNNFL